MDRKKGNKDSKQDRKQDGKDRKYNNKDWKYGNKYGKKGNKDKTRIARIDSKTIRIGVRKQADKIRLHG